MKHTPARETAEEMQVNLRAGAYLLKMAKDRLGAHHLPETVRQAVCTRQLWIQASPSGMLDTSATGVIFSLSESST